ncbi:MAG: N-6 DNA methylase [Deltaproteobacteria bacterium]|nr:N-6 DNA methylase [Deltaproteobacteria bacterium]MBI2229942.1 N-6 DNA methylase [Deltaproteobacteria bacterium]MBI3065291.1 N-6 DNA methylase [Deltaproteobacteria bacterium]
MMERFFATCPRGLELILAGELRLLGAEKVHAVGGGVHFGGDILLCYRANLASRVASRILWQVSTDRYRDEDDIYRRAYALPWTDWFDAARTIRVDVTATKSPLTSLNFVTLKIKDAVCDKIRRLTGRRPSVDTHQPNISIQAHLTDRDFTLYLDTTGEPLFKRGKRIAAGEAPLRENLAAGILRLAGWEPGIPVLDPMCGSGTILLEAALMALDIAPGLGRHFAFEKFKNFDGRRWRELLQRSQAQQRPKTPLAIYGSDLSADALKTARANLAVAGLERAVSLKQANVLEISAPAKEGIIVTNPPYGVRLGEQRELAEFYPKLGDALKKNFAGWRAYILSADMRLPKLIRLAASKRTPLFNGALECRLFEYKMVAGGMRKKKAEA